MTQQGAAWLSRVGCGSVGSASACCNAGTSLILGSAPHDVSLLLSKDTMKIQETEDEIENQTDNRRKIHNQTFSSF